MVNSTKGERKDLSANTNKEASLTRARDRRDELQVMVGLVEAMVIKFNQSVNIQEDRDLPKLLTTLMIVTIAARDHAHGALIAMEAFK